MKEEIGQRSSFPCRLPRAAFRRGGEQGLGWFLDAGAGDDDDEVLLLLLACSRQDDALTNTTHTHPHHPRHAHTQHILSSLRTLPWVDN